MLTIRLVTILFFISSSVKAQNTGNKPFVIKGNVHGLNTGTKVYLIKTSKINTRQPDTVSTAVSKNGTFKLKHSCKLEGEIYWIKLDTTLQKFEKRKRTDFSLLVDNSLIKINGEWESWPNALVKNSKATSEYTIIADDIRSLNASISKKYEDSTGSIFSQKFKDEYKHRLVELLKKYRDQYAAPLILKNLILSVDISTLDFLYNNLSNKIRKSQNGESLLNALEIQKKFDKITPGSIIPDFKVLDIDGSLVNIKEFASKNNFTLIDFWASWCTPCRQELPSLQKIYSRFKDKGFNIIGISIDRKKDSWKKAASEENVPWTQAIQTEDHPVADEVFGIQSIPAYILIDKNGVMVSFESGRSAIIPFGPPIRSEALETTLRDLYTNTKRDF